MYLNEHLQFEILDTKGRQNIMIFIKKIGLTLIAVLTFIGLSAQNQLELEAKKQCEQYIINGKPITENRIDDSLKTGIWTYFYDKQEEKTENIDNAKSFMIVTYTANYPSGICVWCSDKSKLLGTESYLLDTNRILDGKSTWYGKNEILLNEENYKNGLLDGVKN